MSLRLFSQVMKYFKDLRLKFPKVEMEQDYKALKEENVIKDFKMCVRFLFLLNAVVFVFNVVDKSWIEVYVSGGTIVLMIILYSIHRYVLKYLQPINLAMIILYIVSRLVLIEVFYQKSTKARQFYGGYGLASVQCLLLLRLPNLSHKIIGMMTALAIRFLFMSAYVEPGSFGASTFVRHFIIDGFIVYTVYAYEIVFRKVYQNFIQKKEELLKFKEFLAESLPQSLLVVNYESREPLFFNKTFQSTFESSGDSPSSALAKKTLKANLNTLLVDLSTVRETAAVHFNSLFPESSSHSLEEVLEKLCAEGHLDDKTISLSASLAQKGNRRLFEVTITKVKWDSGDGIALIFNDITYQESLIALKLSNINKDKIIATVSHELRTPLNGIIGILDITEKKVNDGEVAEYLSLCKDNAQLLMSLVNSILDLQQISAGKLKLNPGNVDIRNTINSIRQLFNFQCKQKNISLEYEVHKNVPVRICTDENRLKQVLINLIGNAIKFTSKGGIKIEVVPHPDRTGSLQVSVTDTGIGIRQEDQKRLFKMYGKIEDGDSVNKNGVGLGLTISNALVALLNGNRENAEIEVASEYGIGSRFYFDLQRNLQEKKRLSLRKNNELPIVEVKRNTTVTSNEYESETTRGMLIQKTLERTEEGDDNFGEAQQGELDEFFSHELKSRCSDQTINEVNTPILSLPPGGGRSNFNPRMPSGGALSRVEEQQRLMKRSKELTKPNQMTEEGRSTVNVHILIVDDNPFNLLVAKSLIQDSGCKVKTALSGQEAIEIVKKSFSEDIVFKIIFMDCQMPIMDGFETTRALKVMMDNNEVPSIPIYGWTANNSEEDVKRCFEAGMVGHLPKPATKEDILKVISN